jgi:hypothetical protein
MASSGCPFDIQPYAKSEIIKKPNIFNLNYTNQDFWSMKARLIEFTRQRFDKEFGDFVESSLALMLIENWAFVADTLSFKMDQIANEIFIDTVTEIDNAFRLSKLVGFIPQPPIAAKSLWTASLNNPILTDVVIPTPFIIEVNGGGQRIDMELFPADANNNPILDDNIVIPANSVVNASVIGLEGRSRIQQNDGTGAAGQSIALKYMPVIYDSVRVDVDGVRWEQVEYFTDSQPRREYRVEYDANYAAYIVFGNNRSGLIPSVGSKIQISYRTGGGSRGNLVGNAVQTETVITVPGLDYSVPVFFSNYTKAQFGYDGDTIEDIRRKLPAWIRTQNRAVTGLDYKTLADQFATPYQGQIGKAIAVLRNYGCAANIVDIYVLARKDQDALEEAGEQLKLELEDYLEERKMITDHICIRNGTIILVDTQIDVIIDRFYRKFEEELRIKIERRLADLFALPNWEYGQALKDSEVVKVLSDLKEVKEFNINFVTDNDENGGSTVTAKYYEIIRPDVTDINFVYE